VAISLALFNGKRPPWAECVRYGALVLDAHRTPEPISNIKEAVVKDRMNIVQGNTKTTEAQRKSDTKRKFCSGSHVAQPLPLEP